MPKPWQLGETNHFVPLQNWESRFAKAIGAITADQRDTSGALLPVIPPREEWEQFIADVQSEWWNWEWRSL